MAFSFFFIYKLPPSSLTFTHHLLTFFLLLLAIMYPHSNSTPSRAAYTTDSSPLQPPYPYLVTSMHSISISSTSHQQHDNLIPDYQLGVTEFDPLVNSNISFSNNSCSSGCSSYSSPTFLNNYGNNQRPSLMHRSVSSHSLLRNTENHHPISSLFAELFDSDDGPVRRALSTGDLQVSNLITIS